jgi:coatomer subunit beta
MASDSKADLFLVILDGDFFLATVLLSTLTKMVMRHAEISKDSARTNALKAEAMLIGTSIIRVGSSDFCKSHIDEDSVDRILACIRSLSEFQAKKALEETFLE